MIAYICTLYSLHCHTFSSRLMGTVMTSPLLCGHPFCTKWMASWKGSLCWWIRCNHYNGEWYTWLQSVLSSRVGLYSGSPHCITRVYQMFDCVFLSSGRLTLGLVNWVKQCLHPEADCLGAAHKMQIKHFLTKWTTLLTEQIFIDFFIPFCLFCLCSCWVGHPFVV